MQKPNSMKKIRTLILSIVIISVISISTYYYLYTDSTIQTTDVLLSPEMEQRLEETKPNLLVYKSMRRVFLVENGKLVLGPDNTYVSWPISLGNSPIGTKEKEGDQKTPEGLYRFSDYHPSSEYHGSLLIQYPNSEDASRGEKAKIISSATAKSIQQAVKKGSIPDQHTAMGGLVLLHGTSKTFPKDSDTRYAYTNGCVGLSNVGIYEIRERLPSLSGTVLIIP
jgi:murein L,D-transpeptidase YafK